MRNRSRVFKLLTCFVLLLGIWIFLAPALAKNLIVEKSLEKADVILVLSGSTAYIERTQKAARVYKRGVADIVLLTDDGVHAGWSQSEQRNPPFIDLAKKLLVELDVPAERIEVLLPEVTGTIYEARVLKDRIAEGNWKSVLLVTSAYHTKRALWTFHREINDDRIEIGIVSPAVGEQTPPPFTWWLRPRGWQVVAGEYVKFVVYWLFY